MGGMSQLKISKLKRTSLAGFSLPEAVVALGIGTMAVAGGMALNQQELRIVKSVRESAAASSVLEERVEQLRIATWRQITDVAYLRDSLFPTIPKSAFAMPGLTEKVTVTAFPNAAACTGILIEKPANAAVVVRSSGTGLDQQRLAKVAVQVTWLGKDGRQRTRELATVISNAGISRTNLAALGASGEATGSITTTTTTSSTTTTATTSTDTTTTSSGSGRGNVGGQPGIK
jgi:Tfp pilus assembly protein PilV